MKKKLLFMSGLPRSGSTLLSALLNQNPRVHCEPASPAMDFVVAVNKVVEHNEHYNAYPKPSSVLTTVRSLFDGYYSEVEKPVVFDKNRGWPGQVKGLEQCVVEKAKIICPVRNIDAVLASLLRIANENPLNKKTGKLNFIDRSLVLLNRPLTDESRCEFILSDKGMIGQSMGTMLDAIKKGYRDRLHFVEYDSLVSDPNSTLKALYEFVDETPYDEHDFSNIRNEHRERDTEVFAVPYLHEVRTTLSKSKTDPKVVLPEKFYNGCQGKELWRLPLSALTGKAPVAPMMDINLW